MSNFDTTNWSLVFETQGEKSESQEAFEKICRAYWGPLFLFVKRAGYDEETARDLVQGFFLHLVSTRSIHKADPTKGRFRNFLLASLKNFVADQHDRQTAQKRSPGTPILSLDAHSDDPQRRVQHPIDENTPETVYARRWSAQMVEQALTKLEREQVERGRGDLFANIRSYLVDNQGPPYKEVAERLVTTESAVKSAVRTQRKRLGVLLRDEVAQVLADAATVDQELREILRNLEEAGGAA